MQHAFSRREFLKAAAAVPALAALPQWAAEPDRSSFRFIFLGDLHFDKLEHHDMAWLQRLHPADVRQVQDYSHITRDILPRLFATVRETIAELNPSASGRVALVAQTGDFVEGLCGNAELARRQDQEAINFVREARLGIPFLFSKGNHDVTGDGAADAYRQVFHPFLSEEVRMLSPKAGELRSSNYSIEHGNALFAFFDAYDRESLDWLEALAARRTARHFFLAVHPPVVPYGARSTWHLYSNTLQRAQREKLLDLLGRHEAIVLSGHIHKFSLLVRTTGKGRFLQLALNSVVPALDVKPKDLLSGVKDYNPDQVRVEPEFSPGTAPERRAVYEAEAPHVKQFEYADLPGYAVISVEPERVRATICRGASREVWRELDFSKLLAS